MPSKEPRSGTRILVWVMLIKLVTLGIVFAVEAAYPAIFDHAQYAAVYRGNHGFPATAPPSADIVFRTWDAEHYLRIAQTGYRAHGPESAFYPLYPLLLRAIAFAVPLPLWLLSVLASTLLGIAALAILRESVDSRLGSDDADFLVLALALQPAAFFTVLPYSESLFLLLLVAFGAALDRQRFLVAGLLGGLAALCRPVGVFTLVPLLVALSSKGIRWTSRATALLPLLGWLAYFGILAAATGDGSTGIRIQRQFLAAPSLARLADPIGFIQAFVDVRAPHSFLGSALDRLAFVLALGAIVRAFRRSARRVPDLALASLLVVVPAVTAQFTSFTRYVSVVTPVFEELTRFLGDESRRSVRRLILVAFAVLQLALLLRHVTHGWAG